MKRAFFLAFVLMLAMSASAQIRYEVPYATHPDQMYVSGTLNEDSVHVGNWTWWHPNGKVFRQGKYDNQGRKVGVWRVFYNDGSKHEENVMSGNGTSRTWYADGKLQSEVKVVDGKKDGMFVSWYNNGQKKDEVPYVNGVKEGKTREWHENGKLKFEGEGRAGRRMDFLLAYQRQSGYPWTLYGWKRDWSVDILL